MQQLDLSNGAAFLRHARLDQDSFYAMLEDRFSHVGLKQLRTSPFAGFVFRGFSNGATEVDLASAEIAASAVERILSDFRRLLEGVTPTAITHPMYMSLMANPSQPPPSLVWDSKQEMWLQNGLPFISAEGWKRWCARADFDEIFARYDVDRDGVLSAGETVMMILTSERCLKVFVSVADGAQHLNVQQTCQALFLLGMSDAEIPAVHRGMVLSAVNTTASGSVDVFELTQGCCRILRPVTLHKQVQQMPNWPGWPCFQTRLHPHSEIKSFTNVWGQLRDLVDSLNTGDIILMNLTDGTSRFTSFALETLWTHVAVVVKHDSGPRSGHPNLETEYLLNDHPFRWGTHRFCSPRYCRCYATNSAKEAVMEIGRNLPISSTECLESSGQGVHIYNLSARLFLGFNATRSGTIAVRRLKQAPGRNYAAKVESFVNSVRGRLYSVSNEDGMRSMTCSEMAAAFYQHMGWLPNQHKPFHQYSPTDFGNGDVLLGGGAEWGDLELVRDEWSSAALPLIKPASSPKTITGGSRVMRSML